MLMKNGFKADQQAAFYSSYTAYNWMQSSNTTRGAKWNVADGRRKHRRWVANQLLRHSETFLNCFLNIQKSKLAIGEKGSWSSSFRFFKMQIGVAAVYPLVDRQPLLRESSFHWLCFSKLSHQVLEKFLNCYFECLQITVFRRCERNC